jgi:hypothetical protein
MKKHFMKNIIKSACMVIGGSLMLQACSKFEQTNSDPKSANEEQLQVEYAINGSITGAQMNPDIAERSFVLYWKTAGRQHRSGGLSSGGYNDDWSNVYYNGISGWLNAINLAVDLAEKRKDIVGNGRPYTKNQLQVARIWRAYLMSEMSDNFGPIPIKAFQGVNPAFNEVKDVYYYLLAELKDASESIDENILISDDVKKFDPAYGFDFKKWKRYANSMRMRLAMRLSEVDPAKAKAEFEEAAATNNLITDMTFTFKVKEKDGWDDLTGVMSRSWNSQMISASMNNMFVGLGGVTSAAQLPATMHAAIKPADWMGLKLTNHFTTMTNDPNAGFWLDGLPQTIDPRAYKAFIIPGDFDNPDFTMYPDEATAKTTKRNLEDAKGNPVLEIDAKYTWNANTTGDWAEKGAMNKLYTYEGTTPRMAKKFRMSTSERIFFAPWETYFLMAEASERGWATPIAGKAAYEAGIQSSFEYWGVTAFLGTYLNSQDFNRLGTSVSWNHTAEPPAFRTMNYKDGYTNTPGTVNINYPSNTLYKNGSVKNDHLTKIITQKAIAQCPWLPLETWNDQRRLGLPFFENPAIDKALPNLPALNRSNYTTSNIKFFPQRLRYPSNLQNNSREGYQQAVSFLNGPDEVLTPLWWAKH